MDMIFEWDDEKNRSNYKKHGISFDTAKHIFEDEYRIEIYDEVHSIHENRYDTIGLVEDILFVVYTIRDENKIRIISARIATTIERRFYYDHRDNG